MADAGKAGLIDPPEASEAVPDARVRRRRWGLSVAWLVPVVAAAVAGYLVYDRVRQAGPTITITFADGDGIKVGQTEVRYRGVPIGEVREIDLAPDHGRVVVSARLRHSAAAVARDGSVFWIVRPQVGPTSITGLATVLTGPYIQVLPGTGNPQTLFTGVDHPSPTLYRRGLKVVLATARLTSVRTGSPIYYRGIEVGSVVSVGLSRDATTAHADVFIDHPYTRLVRIGSRFWSVSGLDVHVGLFKGVDINLESLRSLAIGGVAFATPDATNPPAKAGTIFVLHEAAEKEWLTWTPKIPLPPTGE
jgi:paraquat-inducible protein B